MERVGVVVIGRNEGARLARCLRSVDGHSHAVIYVDSGSTDASVDLARSMGAHVITLDMSTPFTAARARNAGFDRLLAAAPDLEYVQFVDGDCELVEGWLPAAAQALDDDPTVAATFGRLRERHPEASVYNRLADIEWDTPIGETTACGGNALMRVAAFRQVGGFDATLASVEEPELCQRFLRAAWKVWRLDAEMGLHDAAMLHFRQWWTRTVRSGYGFLDASTRFGAGPDGSFDIHVRRARRWSLGWPSLVVLASVAGRLAGGRRMAVVTGGAVAMALPAQMARLAVLCHRRRALGWRTAVPYGVLTMAGKWPSMWGQHQYRRDAAAGCHARLIEYK